MSGLLILKKVAGDFRQRALTGNLDANNQFAILSLSLSFSFSFSPSVSLYRGMHARLFCPPHFLFPSLCLYVHSHPVLQYLHSITTLRQCEFRTAMANEDNLVESLLWYLLANIVGQLCIALIFDYFFRHV